MGISTSRSEQKMPLNYSDVPFQPMSVIDKEWRHTAPAGETFCTYHPCWSVDCSVLPYSSGGTEINNTTFAPDNHMIYSVY
jgi:hypothetical protein